MADDAAIENNDWNVKGIFTIPHNIFPINANASISITTVIISIIKMRILIINIWLNNVYLQILYSNYNINHNHHDVN